MIVRTLDGKLLLITQPDHARLARFIMSHCVALAHHPRRESILLAVAEHDAGWAVEDANPLVGEESGEVLDFIHAPTSVRQGVWPRSVALLADRDPWAAALVAQHAVTVYARLGSEPQWRTFFAEMSAIRDDLVLKTGMHLAELEADYVFVRLGDLISLAFCTGSNELTQFGGWLVERDADRIHVSPDPFGAVEIPVVISGRAVRDRSFKSAQDLQGELDGAPAAELTGTVAGRA